MAFKEVLPDSYNWSNLTRQEIRSYIALGIKYVDERKWLILQELLIDPLYAIEIDDTYIGTLEKDAIVALRLSGYHGLAFDGEYTAKHEMIFFFILVQQ